MSLRTLASSAMLGLALAGCTVGLPRPESPRLFALEATFDAAPRRDAAAPAMLIAPPTARPAFDSARMIYVRRAYEVQFFANHEWVAPPAQMLAPLLIQALEHGERFRAVQSARGVVAALRLETEIVALQQEFTGQPSQTRFVLKAEMVDVAKRRALAAEQFEAVEPAPSDDPYGGVVAANRALARVLRDLAAWCDAHVPRGGD